MPEAPSKPPDASRLLRAYAILLFGLFVAWFGAAIVVGIIGGAVLGADAMERPGFRMTLLVVAPLVTLLAGVYLLRRFVLPVHAERSRYKAERASVARPPTAPREGRPVRRPFAETGIASSAPRSSPSTATQLFFAVVVVVLMIVVAIPVIGTIIGVSLLMCATPLAFLFAFINRRNRYSWYRAFGMLALAAATWPAWLIGARIAGDSFTGAWAAVTFVAWTGILFFAYMSMLERSLQVRLKAQGK